MVSWLMEQDLAIMVMGPYSDQKWFYRDKSYVHPQLLSLLTEQQTALSTILLGPRLQPQSDYNTHDLG